MRRLKIVVSDLSVLSDLAKVKLIELAVKLPCDFIVPDVVLAQQSVDLGPYTIEKLLDLGFIQGRLDAGDTRLARNYYLKHRRRICLADCFAWRLAEIQKAILMTGNTCLGGIAAAAEVKVHNLLWAVEMMVKHETGASSVLTRALDHFDSDPLFDMPKDECRALREKLRKR